MIFKLLTEIRPLSNHKVLYDSYTHATHVMSILSNRTNNKALILAGLLHEVKPRLGEYKFKKCLEIIENTAPYHSNLPQITHLLEAFSETNGKSKETLAIDVLSRGDSNVELLFLADTLSQVELLHSTIALNSIKQLVTSLINKELIDEEDDLVIKINEVINHKLIHHKHGSQTSKARKT